MTTESVLSTPCIGDLSVDEVLGQIRALADITSLAASTLEKHETNAFQFTLDMLKEKVDAVEAALHALQVDR